MPSKSKKQARLMAAVAHNPAFAKKVGIPQSVGEEFNAADEARGMSRILSGKRGKPYNEVGRGRRRRMYNGSGNGGA